VLLVIVPTPLKDALIISNNARSFLLASGAGDIYITAAEQPNEVGLPTS